MRIISFIFILISFNVSANSLILGGVSYHPAKYYKDGAHAVEFNSRHDIFALELSGVVVGKMENSYYENVKFAGYQKTFATYGPLDLGVIGLLSEGYELSILPRVGEYALGNQQKINMTTTLTTEDKK